MSRRVTQDGEAGGRSAPRPRSWAALILSIVAALPVAATAVRAADLEAGERKARQCALCHGPQGLSTLPNAPHLAGQPAIYLAEQMKHYKSGKRLHEVMSVVARQLSDEDIDDLAAWYESIRIEVVE